MPDWLFYLGLIVMAVIFFKSDKFSRRIDELEEKVEDIKNEVESNSSSSSDYDECPPPEI